MARALLVVMADNSSGGDRPNVVIVLLDTARADVFEPYGARAGSTPTVAQLSRSGHAAPSMYAASGWTLPSHAAMFTGMHPRAAGLARAPGRTPASCRTTMESHVDRLLPEVLRRNGFETHAASANLWISEDSGFATGFDEFTTVKGTRSSAMVQPGRKAAAKWAWEALRNDADDGGREALAAMSRFLDDRAGDAKPFFWFVNLVECHSPYLPPRPYSDRGPISRVKAARANRRHLTMGAIWEGCLGGFDINDEDLELLRHFYGRSIALLDDWVAKLLQTLDRAGVLDDTMIIITSDHGENLGEANLIGHSFSLDDRLIKVPFIASGPGAPVLDRVASLMELPRLVAEGVGLADHPWSAATVEGGIAVAEFDAPADRDDKAVEMITRFGLGEPALELLTSAQTAATNGRHKLVRLGREDRFFDLDADPLEVSPLPASSAPQQLRDAVERASAARAPAVDHVDTPSSDDIEERMRLLGYM